MLKKLWKLVRSDENVMQALRQTSVSYDLSPSAPRFAANNDELRPGANRHANARLWLDDWSEKDEERLTRSDHPWEGYVR